MQVGPVTTQSAPSPRKFGALRHRDFALLWAGLLVSNSGTWMQSVAQGWLAYALTNSPLYLGFLGAAFAVPMIVLPIVGGTIADRVERLTILKFTQAIMMLCAVAMATLAYLRIITIWDMIAIAFISSVALAVDNPTRQALIPDLVPRQELLGAISLNSVAFNGAALIGPAVAGLILQTGGDGATGDRLFQSTSFVFYLNAASFLAVLIPVFIIRPRPIKPPPIALTFRAAIFEGLTYVQKRPVLLLLLTLAAVTSLFGRSFNQLLPVFARDVLQVGSEGYGVMLALPGAGTLLAGFILAGGGQNFNRRWLIGGSLLGVVLATIAFALSRSFPISLALLGLSGLCTTAFGAASATVLQTETEGHLRGRVMSLYAVTLIGLGPLGSLIPGALATVIPVSLAVALPTLIIVVFLAYAVMQPAWKQVR